MRPEEKKYPEEMRPEEKKYPEEMRPEEKKYPKEKRPEEKKYSEEKRPEEKKYPEEKYGPKQRYSVGKYDDGDKRKPYDDDKSKPYEDEKRKPYETDKRKSYDDDDKRKPYETDKRKSYDDDDKRKPYDDDKRKPYDDDKRKSYDDERKPYDDEKDKPYVDDSKSYGQCSTGTQQCCNQANRVNHLLNIISVHSSLTRHFRRIHRLPSTLLATRAYLGTSFSLTRLRTAIFSWAAIVLPYSKPLMPHATIWRCAARTPIRMACLPLAAQTSSSPSNFSLSALIGCSDSV